ncbi:MULTISPECIES: ArsC family reductase [unclassified Pseudoalteromonas]|uniref:ArsC family reductase n=1 Tax=unclassified Pseudoalteromonas TaxID=194690 RepID=UPI001F2FDCD7|nr:MULTISPECIES: ArsC family reductase [unclassified Pseudoalteromonas]MCF2826949.1 ArsC family reductase [Pseudoalteromonas sp. OF5H-5]MCF2832426.1 ArsC family reductase [Pseudoalteromonas sp. DL2-H6]MCF2923922.1 ArsC family reductase [Pseudoalteromonas sp. DL2-H1]
MTITMYGISNCDTIKKAKKYLQENNIEFTFHDYRKDGLDEALLTAFIDQLGWENVLNKRGTTYRALSEEQKQNLDAQSAKQHLLAAPAMIKRPILQYQGQYHLGFKAAQYDEIFA